MVTCLVCCGPLEEREGSQWYCPRCGYWYPVALLAAPDFDMAAWEHIQRDHLACTKCESSPPGMPKVWAGKRGQPIPCPVHARRVRWWRWLGFSKRSRSTTPVD